MECYSQTITGALDYIQYVLKVKVLSISPYFIMQKVVMYEWHLKCLQ